jgi:cytochrome c oxidase cbb3-type subunit III
MSNATSERVVVHTTGDGIEEFDNRLPRWWLATFYGSIIFAIGYWFTFHVFNNAGGGQVTPPVTKEDDFCAFTEGFSPDISKTASLVADGEKVFASNCAACHGAKAGGIIGPNLTDEYWLHGGSPEQIGQTICKGVPAKGMPTWGPPLGQDRIRAVVAYLLTVQNTNVAGGKSPQGTRLGP